MIFERLVLHNFGVYGGKHEILLTPPSADKPIVLFGALNGAGKTTILDAIQLALHGKLASPAVRASTSYEEFLQRCIHRNTDPKEGAAVELEFTHRSGGQEHRYCIRRSWSVPTRAARERLAVSCDGEFDQLLSDTWPEHAETFLPSGIAPLFLFDGEQIERLADPDQSSQMLATAIHSLLGIDVVDQLSADLTVVERRKRIEIEGDTTAAELEEIETEVAALARRRDDLVQERASVQTGQDRAQKRLREVELRYRREGGDLFKQRTTLEADLASVREQLSNTEDELRDIASGDLPLLLVSDLLTRVHEQDRRERSSVHAALLCEALESRDTALLELAAAENAAPKLLHVLRDFLREDRAKRTQTAGDEVVLGLSDATSSSLSALCSRGFDSLRERAAVPLQREQSLRLRCAATERKLASVPQPEAIEALGQELDHARLAVIDLEKRLAHLDTQIEETQRMLARLEERRLSVLTRDIDARFALEDNRRVIQHAQRVRETLRQFRSELVRENVNELSTHVLESYQQLLRKRSLIESIEIDPVTFGVLLMGPSGGVVRPQQLSAGERQLLATAILWGLARAAGRALPMVIDTPLGRLDSTHRSRLVERYFPHASHQVILLSTDEEIDSRYYARLEPFIGRTYCLEFDERTQSTAVRNGYFKEVLS